MFLVSILTTLALVVVGGHRQPFTAFNPVQFSRVHAPAPSHLVKRQTYQSSNYQPRSNIQSQPVQTYQSSNYQPRSNVQSQPVQTYQSSNYQPRSNVQFSRTQPVQQKRFQPSSGQYQYKGPFNSFGASSKFFRASGNIIEQTRAQADSTKALLKNLGNNRKAVEYINAVIRSNKCLANLDDAIEAVENAAKLVEKNGAKILSLYKAVEKLEEEKELTRVVKTSADILRELAVLIPSLATEPSRLCNTSPKDTIESFSGLAKILEDISNTNDLQISSGVRQKLRKSSKIVSDTTTFLGKVNKSLSSYTQFCGQGKEYQNESLVAVVGVLEDLAVLFEGFGDAEKAEGFRKNGSFIKKILATFDELDVNSDLDCGSFDALATTLDELAEIIEDVGIEQLSEQLGLDLEFL